jgi:hypothetical protein
VLHESVFHLQQFQIYRDTSGMHATIIGSKIPVAQSSLKAIPELLLKIQRGW